MKLIIVESPTKAKTIANYAGKDFKVISSKGHIIDLPAKSFGIEIEKNFETDFKPIPTKKKIISQIVEESKKAASVYIATDPDREGEAIAYHIASVVNPDNKKDVKRVLFYEITKKGIQKGISTPTDIDMNLVNSQYARRILDRIVGYKVSPFLWKSVRKGLSAGRVQSVALRLICEKEDKIDAFKPKDFYKIKGIFSKAKAEFSADLIRWGKLKPLDIRDIDAKKFEKELLTPAKYEITDFKTEEKYQHAPPPFITSTIQQTASNVYNFPAKKTMKVAQSLYEGVNISGKLTGLITYMRTDSTRISDDAMQSIRTYISSEIGKEYLSGSIQKYKTNPNAQDAHEAIRPADINLTPDEVREYLSKDQIKLYQLIWERTLASQMNSAKYSITTAELVKDDFVFRGIGNSLLFDGYLKVYPYSRTKDLKNEIPPMDKGDHADIISADIKKDQTKPPSRYSDATLVKALEANGIGRPSTYASIIDILQKRDYVIKDKKIFIPTELGRIVNRILVQYFDDIFNVNFTAGMETELDMVETARIEHLVLLKNFYDKFAATLDNAQQFTKDIKKGLEQKTDEVCEKCGSHMIIKWGRFGKFLACSNYPSCKNTKPLPEDEEKLEELCPECGKGLIVKTGRFGKFVACSDYPKCKFTKPYSTGIKCPECSEGEIVEKKSGKGRVFFGCSNYPKCEFAIWSRPVKKTCTECSNHFMEDKGKNLVCPKCGHKEPKDAS